MARNSGEGSEDVIEIMDEINTYLLARIAGALPEGLEAPSAIHEDFFPGDQTNEVMCRHDPSPVITRRYMTGAYWADFNFSYYARSLDGIAARQLLEAIQEVLEIDNFEDLFGVAEGRIIVVTRPSPVGEDEAGVKLYTASYKLVYFRREV